MEFSSSELGQGLVEYGLVLVLVSVASIVIMQILGLSIFDLFEYATIHLGEVFA